MNGSKQSRSVIFHNTTVNAAKSLQANLYRAGQKRKPDDDTLEAYPTNKIVVLPGPTYPGDFHRPTLDTAGLPRLKAGEIHDATDRGQSEYSQRRALALTPSPSVNPLLNLSHPSYGLPKQLVANFASLGIKSIYPWQSECLLRSGALQGGKNLVYTAPTGGGKSLVADILMLKKIVETPGKKALLVLPYVALVQEKLRWLRKVVEGISKTVLPDEEKTQTSWRKRGDENSIRVAGFFGGSKSSTSWDDFDIAVCTIEKVSLLIPTHNIY